MEARFSSLLQSAVNSSNSVGTSITATQLAISAIIVAACLVLMVNAAKFGFSKIVGRYAVMTNSIFIADEAVRLSPSDPEAHQARAIVLSRLRLPADSAKEMEIAVSLRPQDDYLWLELGGFREAAGINDAALSAFDRAVEFAPYYGHTRWQRGNLLIRMRRYEEGFTELRLAVSSNRNFLPAFIDLAWGITRRDAKITEQLVQVSDDKTRLAFARFLARHGKAADTLDQFRQIKSTIPREAKDDLIRSLIQHKAYPEAYEIWKGDRAETSPITNGSFEDELILEGAGFGWQSAKPSAVSFALDLTRPHHGSRSLRISFEGYENQQQPVLSQVLLVKPSHAYRVTFAVKTRDLVTGGLPLITVNDASTAQVIAKSEPFQPRDNEWISMSLEFTTLSTSKAVSLNLQRNRCSSSPCPIFGQLWLDSFALDDKRSNQ